MAHALWTHFGRNAPERAVTDGNELGSTEPVSEPAGRDRQIFKTGEAWQPHAG
jgi:hypothetical protein